MNSIRRRGFLSTAASVAGNMLLSSLAYAESAAPMLTPGVPDGVATYANMVTLPGKQPLIQLADRQPNYEAPLE